MSEQEKHTPQVSKKEVAIGNLEAYMGGFLAGVFGELESGGAKIRFTVTPEYYVKIRKVSEDLYRIVKRAEGFDV